MKGLILSGGKGTRLYPLTYTRAKQLIPVANKPVLVRVIEAIRDAGVDEIGIVIGHTGPEIREAIGDGSRWGVQITYIPQESPDGLAHAVKISQDFLGDDRFVMFLGDNVIQGGISRLITDFATSAWNSQIVLKQVPNPSSFGVAVLNSDGRIDRLIEKPADPPSDLALVGIYMFDSNIFKAVHAIKPSKRGEYEITDAIQWLIEQGYTVYPHVHQGWWIDTGKPGDMLDANGYVLEELKPNIAPDAQIINSEVDGRVTVEAGAVIENSIVRGPTIIGEGTRIVNSFVGPFTSIYHHTTVQDCEIERCIILEHSHISDLPARLQDSLIGRAVTLTRSERVPRVRAMKMNLGDNSSVWID
ncbi:MAG TPA: glucose-1-phosphate thymidylyltransferase [Aggregatilineales bacterium]|jgi:glucose-1-phosphate thymidylyltransferase|nr:glucose-1-phosphate thymidylyltransferase [Aggregatilineales bacterium]